MGIEHGRELWEKGAPELHWSILGFFGAFVHMLGAKSKHFKPTLSYMERLGAPKASMINMLGASWRSLDATRGFWEAFEKHFGASCKHFVAL